MTNQIENDVRAWLGDGRTIRGLPSPDNGGAGLVRVILESFQESNPAQIEQMPILETMARVCGYESIERMLGNAVCMADGGRSLTLKAN